LKILTSISQRNVLGKLAVLFQTVIVHFTLELTNIHFQLSIFSQTFRI